MGKPNLTAIALATALLLIGCDAPSPLGPAEAVEQLQSSSVPAKAYVGEEARRGALRFIRESLSDPEHIRVVYQRLGLDPEARIAELRHLEQILLGAGPSTTPGSAPSSSPSAFSSSSSCPWGGGAASSAADLTFTGISNFPYYQSCYNPGDLDHQNNMSVTVGEEQLVDDVAYLDFNPLQYPTSSYRSESRYSISPPNEGWRETAMNSVQSANWGGTTGIEQKSFQSYDQVAYSSSGDRVEPTPGAGEGDNCHSVWIEIYVWDYDSESYELYWDGWGQLCEY